MAETIWQLLDTCDNAAIALSAPERPTLDYAGLKEQVASTAATLAARGVAQDDTVGIVLPNGPEMASAFLSVACSVIAAPLNPSYTAEEFAFYLTDLDAKAVMVMDGVDTPARDVARAKGMNLLEIRVADDAPAGRFLIEGQAAAANAGRQSGPDDTALVLHTSGTTSRPKIVPLSQRNLSASAQHIRDTLALTSDDRCLNIMPLFHIHGLIAVILASTAAGASVYCTPGFNAMKVFGWMETAEPTWYSAVPTMHQAIVARAARNTEVVGRLGLRFIRSSSASLPPQVMTELEATFGCPVIEAYGMTEAAHQMASNPLPPADRKAGTVGLAAGPEVAIINEDGALLGQGAKGEVVIRGPNVTAGYRNNEKANAEAFTGGWFRTGDQGVIDADGYLTITGRLKEIINRGGEKVSPREVDDVLMDHPAVAQVVTFALPHDKLGEEVAAAIVLKDGKTAEPREIASFASERLAAFKVPRKVVILDEIPKGATGKLQRIGLAEKLGLA